jgi:hypothetical protein
MKLVTKMFWLTVCVGIGLLCIRQARVYEGYCPAKGRYTTDAERQSEAVRSVLGTYPPNVIVRPPNGGLLREFSGLNSPAYASVSSFLETYPHCCSMVESGSEGWRPSTFDRITGHTFGIVAIVHDVAYRDGGEIKRTTNTDYAAISACGDVHPSQD